MTLIRSDDPESGSLHDRMQEAGHFRCDPGRAHCPGQSAGPRGGRFAAGVRVNETDDIGHRVGRRREGHVLVISMERAKRNAIDRAMADALDDALNELDDDHDLWAGS